MDQKEQAKKSNLMKLEAMALFTSFRAQASSNRWWYFSEMKRIGHPIKLEQNISQFRACLYWDYIFAGIDCQVYLESDARSSLSGVNCWQLSFSGIEGKDHALIIEEHLKSFRSKGYYIPNGNENLERQMNFSLGLYGSCLMHVDIHFPSDQKPLPCLLEILDWLETINQRETPDLSQALKTIETKRVSLLTNEEEDPDIIMGDWQTWK